MKKTPLFTILTFVSISLINTSVLEVASKKERSQENEYALCQAKVEKNKVHTVFNTEILDYKKSKET